MPNTKCVYSEEIHIMKTCSRCKRQKPDESFAQREDSWGRYAWCGDCQVAEGRHKMTAKQRRYVDKTQLFSVETYVR